ncbi:hypothetical protein [Bacteroides acidifaciens]|uniref:6-bladed beta-propeller n=1 Tax=Bacteroides acidifaciens TaxID=85831 RepID=A0A7J0A1S0_9BACE|nr:hypothetical protein [Bacteroides acidifaciens]MBF0731954.1 hypothetical protein [Bacteroides acidifaciens]MBF0837282.1 hypothetical protein [Bacteroides acidifaciens]NDO55497.1 hypothetical protein [Bacteroides acidifaciens]TFU44749.1 hypothetical protein E4T97_21370 [Bacteroides acidifaciens]GFH86323.1 hypothetical protein IMSAGC001_01731 [Bacteroides acidifaciens]
MRIILLTIVIWGGICLVGCVPSSSTVPLVYSSIFLKDTTVILEKVPMYPAQFNPRCILLSNERILVRTSTLDNAVYSVFSYPEMKHLSYFGEQSEFIVPLEQFNDELYLVRNDSLYFYKWIEGDSLKLFSTSFFDNIMGQQMLGVTKLNDNLYAYTNNCLDKGMNEFFIINLSQKQKESKGVYPDTHVNFSSISDFKSAYAHEIIAKPDGSRLLVFYYRTRRCRIYNQNGILLRDILLNYEPCQTIIDTDIKRRFLHIKDAYVTNNMIYLLCPDTKEVNSPSSLLVANWDGEFKAIYHLGQTISYFFIDELLNCFYGVNSNDPYHFYKLKLSKN